MGAAICTNSNKIVQDTRIKSYNLKDKFYDRLWHAVSKNDLPSIEKFIDFNGVTEADLFDLDGNTLLHLAASLGRIEALTLLIERTAANPDFVNSKLQTPLHMACLNDRA